MFKKNQDSEFIEEVLSNGHIKRYIKGRTLGKGGFAECYEFVSEETGKRYAAKVIDKQTLGKGKAREKLESQIIIHKSLRHQNIVKFQHFFQDHDYVYLLLELCSNNTLNQLLKRRKILTEVEVKYYTLQLLHALKYIHQHKVIHRDLKLGNFFLDEHLQLKVGDFGLANTLASPHEKRKTVCGTPNYIAPEIIDSKKGHSYEVDIWSTGVIVYALLFGKPPFETNEVKLTYEKIKACDYAFPKSSVSDSAKDFIEKMLVLNPAERATIKELLQHDFLTAGDIPLYLPLSALACPPSRTFLQQAKNDHHLSVSKRHQGDGHIQSSRTSKSSLLKQKVTIATDKIDSTRKFSKQGKTQRSQGSIIKVASSATMTTINKKAPLPRNEDILVYVTFFEQQPKYGMFYLMNTTSVGMRFNDQTCLTSNQKLTQFRYIVMHNHTESSTETFDQNRQPEYLHKKIKIIRHFDRLLGNKASDTPANPLHKIKQDRGGLKVYLVAYYSVSNFYLLWLSNGIFQANFKDQVDILVDRDEVVHLITKSKKSSFKLSELSLQEEEVKQRVQAICAVIKKVKRTRQGPVEHKKQKENGTIGTSTSQAKLIKKVQSRPILAKNFSSTTNLHRSLKRPLSEYCSNKRGESSQKHY